MFILYVLVLADSRREVELGRSALNNPRKIIYKLGQSQILFPDQKLRQHIPDGDYVADGSQEDEDVEDSVQVWLLVESIEHRSCDVHHTFRYNPIGCDWSC